MPDQKSSDANSPERARELAERSIDTAVDGDLTKARKLAAEARNVDQDAAKDVLREVERERTNAEKYKSGG